MLLMTRVNIVMSIALLMLVFSLVTPRTFVIDRHPLTVGLGNAGNV